MSSLTVVGVWLRVLDEGAAHLADEGAANESLRFCVDVLSEAAVAEGAGEEDTADIPLPHFSSGCFENAPPPHTPAPHRRAAPLYSIG